ncbi:hypothetical protein HH212_05025 [Massilia forsythiae]|uniref:DUF4148 domain-containing protein n=1 Tax=Massilia forsythiae TaxID=2728020 RepID=A0A7Z2VUL0_9BURK|nr:hypothetical protein [Massilia forsythiae]QJD99463.1 hypothetical protein HH212_05025 [Massilia forsythiae]
MSNLNSFQRLLAAGAAGLALCAAALPAAAQQAQQEAVQSVDAVTVTRDPSTGKLRPATAEEQTAMQATRVRQLRAATQTVQQKFHSSGARGARLTDEFMTSSTAVRNADGTIDMVCNDSHGGTEHAAHVHATAANTPVTE